MMRGFVAPDHTPLAQVGQNHPETAARLREMELRALERSGRLAELRSEAGVAVSTKQKIIARLRGQESD
ncbi:MAG: hypothetical protein IPK13_22230 [Deltaproteobacteria bacterium]|nr:hypothetical protein [Deltaproteobacteria bacterium]